MVSESSTTRIVCLQAIMPVTPYARSGSECTQATYRSNAAAPQRHSSTIWFTFHMDITIAESL
jgi:hypothetical protein